MGEVQLKSGLEGGMRSNTAFEHGNPMMATKFDLEVAWMPNERVVRITTQGRLDVEANDRIVAAAISAGEQYGCNRFLIDDRKAELCMSTLDLYDLPERNAQQGVQRGFRVALLYAGHDAKRDFNFYETRTSNTGFAQRVFADEQTALNWLTGGD